MKVNINDWKIVWHFFRPYKFETLNVWALMMLSGFFEMLNLAALYPIINYGLSAQKENALLGYLEWFIRLAISDNLFLGSCVVLIVVSVLAIAAKFIYQYFSNKLLVHMIGGTQKKVLDKFIAADYNFYVKNQQGKLIYAGTTAPERMTMIILTTISLVYSLISAVFLFSLLILLSWQATGLIVLVAALYAAVIKKVTEKYIQKCAQVSMQENQRKNVILNEFITGVKPIKIFMAFNDWKQRHTQAVDRGMWNRFRMLMGRVFPEMFVKFLFFVLIALAGAYLSQRPHAEMIALLPIFGTFAVVVNRFLPLAHRIGSAFMSIAEYVPDLKVVHELLTTEFVALDNGQRKLENFTKAICFNDVCFKYENMSEYLLNHISFSIERRKMTALVGLSGAGKTTIINLLLKLYRPEKGSIEIDGIDIFELSNDSYLSRIGYVSQETFVYNNSFKENIRFGMENCTDQMVIEAAKLANAHEFIMEAPQGYDTIVGDSGIKISGGQRQRVAIARAMLRKPEIIVLDEATSSLDNISEKKIQAAINNISKHTTVLVIAHRLTTVQNADKIIILEKGEVKEQGTHHELLNNKNSYYDLHMSNNSADQNIIEEKVGGELA